MARVGVFGEVQRQHLAGGKRQGSYVMYLLLGWHELGLLAGSLPHGCKRLVGSLPAIADGRQGRGARAFLVASVQQLVPPAALAVATPGSLSHWHIFKAAPLRRKTP